MSDMSEPFNETLLSSVLQTNWLGRRFEYSPVLDSTNDYLRDRLTSHSGILMPHGMMVITDFQTRGRGRLNRRWLSPPNVSLMFSLLFRLGWPIERANWLTMLGGMAAAHAIRAETNLNVRLKWPNDIMVEQSGRWYKVGGLLLESEFDEAGKIRSAVLGMGINVNIPAESLPTQTITPATSLLVAMEYPVSRPRLLVAILRELEKRYTAAAQGQSPQPAWNDLLITLGQPVCINQSDEAVITGIATGTDEWGHLLVRDEEGQVHTVTAGDVI
jgi:BirA family biotin operon repressor/biotin-[acetyl-CoA-carboxylase] ligase